MRWGSSREDEMLCSSPCLCDEEAVGRMRCYVVLWVRDDIYGMFDLKKSNNTIKLWRCCQGGRNFPLPLDTWQIVCVITQLCPTLCDSQEWWPTRLLCPLNFPGKNTGEGCHFILQEIFLIQGQTEVSCIADGFFIFAPAGKPFDRLTGHNQTKVEWHHGKTQKPQ